MTAQPVRIALAQFDFVVGAVSDNARRITQMIASARDEHQADVVVFPELALSGCPAQDLWTQLASEGRGEAAWRQIAEATNGITAVVCGPLEFEGALYNAAQVLRDGDLQARYLKCIPSRWGGVEERHWFEQGRVESECCSFDINGIHVGVLLGNDFFEDSLLNTLVAEGTKLVLVPSANGFNHDDSRRNDALVVRLRGHNGVAMAGVNLVGVQDTTVFDGGCILACDTQIYRLGRAFCDQWVVADYLPAQGGFVPQTGMPSILDDQALRWRALTRAIADYCRKNGFSNVWLGLSGGLDSAVVLALAVDALGAEHVTAVRMPSRYTAGLSNDLAKTQCETLGVRLLTLPIENIFQNFLDTLGETFQGQRIDTTEENLQSRIRGSLLMALTNKFGGLLLSTGNKSECAVGYATIYGDMCGGYAPICDVYKTEIYALAKWRNAQGGQPVIPQEVIDRPPSAELRPDQRDQDSLPPYNVLDAILYRHIEQEASGEEIIASGFDAAMVGKVLHLVRTSEWKRHQAAPGPKVSRRAFGIDRHYPISRGD